MSELSAQLNKIASEKGTQGKQNALLAIAALVILDKNNNVVFDPDDLAGTISRLRAAVSASGVVELESPPAISGPPQNAPGSAQIIVSSPAPNSQFVLTALLSGPAGNDLALQLIDPGDIDIELSLAIKGGGRSIEITLATDHDGVITTTAADIGDLLAASELVSYANAPANDGSGVVSAGSFGTDLGGFDVTGLGIAGKGSRYTDTYNGNLWINQGDAVTPNWVQLATV